MESEKSNKMEPTEKSTPTIIIIIGATGDLTWRKLIPAIYNLYLDKWIPEKFAVLGVSRNKMVEKEFRKHLHEGVDKFSRRGKSKKAEWNNFERCLNYQKGEFNVNSTYSNIEKRIKLFEEKWKVTHQSDFLPGRSTKFI